MKTILLSAVLSLTLASVSYASENGDHPHEEYGEAQREGHAHSADHHEEMKEAHHGKGHHGKGHHGEGMGHGQSLAGRPGKADKVDRTIKVEASDTMSFIHEPIRIKTGETIKFVITNSGAIPHEFSIGTKDEHVAHGKMMVANPDMHHGPGGSSITLAPGKTEILIWHFKEAMQVEVACNIPGHYQAGMHSSVDFEK